MGRLKSDRNLDILRALAVLTVLVVHCLPASLPQQIAGRYGVLIFFVHTALVLLYSLERQLGMPGLVRRFYIQRAFRIYPLSVLCVGTSLAFRISWPATVFTPSSGVSVVANLLLVQNLLKDSRSISSPLWSLPFEIQMYLMLPVLFWLLRRYEMHGAIALTAFSMGLPIAQYFLIPNSPMITEFIP